MIVPDDGSEDTLRTLTYRRMKTKENTRLYGNIHFSLFSKKIEIYSFFFFDRETQFNGNICFSLLFNKIVIFFRR